MKLEFIIAIPVIAFVSVIVIISILARLYRKATKELAFVRTGAGGEKVISNGGAFVFKMFHDVIDVNMKTVRLVVTRKEKQALITKDKIRVDVEAEFYVRVKQDRQAISIAAQTLGDRTQNQDALKTLIEGRFVDALRSVSAEMGLNELHEQRADFVQRVQNTVAADLEKNGLELESVSLTGLDQTNVEHFDENNAFDAQGLTKITKTIEENKKMQNDLRQISDVEIARRNLESEKDRLDIRKQESFARLQQEEEVANKEAEQSSRISLTQSEQKRIADEARILSEREVEEANIQKSRMIAEAEIKKEIAISERTKEKAIAEGQVKQTQINADREVREAEILKEKAVKEAQIASDIALAEKSQEHSKAESLKNTEYAKAVIAEEQVLTAREKEQAERVKQITLIQAQEKAERDAIEKKVAALATAEAAEKEAEAIRVLAEAQERQYEVDAEGLRKKTEAENAVSSDLIQLRIKLALIEALPQIIAESVKPIEHIDSLKVVDVKGLGGYTDNGGSSETASYGQGNGAQDLVNAALRYRAQSPLLDSLLSEIGIKGKSLEDLSGILKEQGIGITTKIDGSDPITSEE
ncbi:flotillin family protein [Spirochaeta cellobiosiphila]|uniref:flotillin family protein n=1 Tax=Spirochaeta cellobiosiphila TaxID=504483 RepID=UPI0004250B63|nr:flotillin domain-containing protein [Spirochaeta cellobiosiphila]